MGQLEPVRRDRSADAAVAGDPRLAGKLQGFAFEVAA
jgi:hypothetical protein